MNLQPILKGPRLTLRPLHPDDFAKLYAAASDPLIWQLHPEPDRYKEDVFRGFFAGAMESGGAFAVIDNSSGEIIGSSRYQDLDPINRTIEIGFTFLTRAYWGRNFNREMKALMLDHAFRHVDVVTFHVGENNFRSQRALEKIGAKMVRKERPDGRVRVVYEITAENSPGFP